MSKGGNIDCADVAEQESAHGDLLLNTELSIKEIAHQSGIEEGQYLLCHFFKRAMGRTPSSYRKDWHRRPARFPS